MSIAQSLMMAASNKKPISYNFGSSQILTNDSSSYTFSSSNSLGVADPKRKALVNVFYVSGPGVVTSVTIAGVSATKVLEEVVENGAYYVEQWVADVPTGTTAEVVVNLSDTAARIGMSMYAIYNASSSTPNLTTTSRGNPKVLTLSPARPAVIIAGALDQANSSTTWTGLNEDFDGVAEGITMFSSASDIFDTSGTKTIEALAASTDPIRRCGVASVWY